MLDSRTRLFGSYPRGVRAAVVVLLHDAVAVYLSHLDAVPIEVDPAGVCEPDL